ncbi:aspartyl-phosphate phosphatase Spo0E family protein [Alkalihalophilus marmarensis]|uniref:aspartyl-phosphate phosphatase Spo0E family protein n=1 Tax=Alkalihalophilus marmarensis TaxID=521377 RepID=UPI002DB7EC9D|nr:aspartyl-phosphate phosphatase Spo0E family protein [Alkalihalophilus marmarensis]MEC2071961.1 aspartyl-phosphate phosphatase Spo0E family protein [Alkalihalophilus marmarensis]
MLMMTCSHNDLLHQIETARYKLNELAQTMPLHSELIVWQSQHLDELLNEYDLLLKEK